MRQPGPLSSSRQAGKACERAARRQRRAGARWGLAARRQRLGQGGNWLSAGSGSGADSRRG